MTLFDFALIVVAMGAAYAVRVVARYAGQRQARRVAELDSYDLWADQLHEWTERPEPTLTGEVLAPKVDELGTWFPAQHELAEAELFDALHSSWPTHLDPSWRPAWASATGAWTTLAVTS